MSSGLFEASVNETISSFSPVLSSPVALVSVMVISSARAVVITLLAGLLWQAVAINADVATASTAIIILVFIDVSPILECELSPRLKAPLPSSSGHDQFSRRNFRQTTMFYRRMGTLRPLNQEGAGSEVDVC